MLMGSIDPRTPSKADLNELELRILDYFAHSDLRTFLNATEVSLRIAREPLRTERSLERLSEVGLLNKAHTFVNGTTFSLSTLGRNFVIDQGIA
jgi:DNA-binding MarR family transcriptional regulator